MFNDDTTLLLKCRGDNSLPMIRKVTLEKINSPHKMKVRLLHCENAQCSSVGTGSYPDRIIVYTIFRLGFRLANILLTIFKAFSETDITFF